MRCVIDTNVIVSALRSPRGASAALIRAARQGVFTPVITPALFLEYEAVCRRSRHVAEAGVTGAEIDLVLDALFALSFHARSHFQVKPALTDPDDELVLEAAINGQAAVIATFNVRDFSHAPRFGIVARVPSAVLGSFVRRS